MPFQIDYDAGDGWIWYKTGIQSKSEAIEEAKALEAQPNPHEPYWPYRVINEKTGKVVWPPIAVQTIMEL